MASLLIENAAVLTLDEADRFIERGSILIEGAAFPRWVKRVATTPTG